MYEGEGSVIYVYLLLYQESKENIFLEYAKRHAAIVERLLNQDEKYDLLSGNAGAAWVIMQLYYITRDDYFLDIVKKAIDILITSSHEQEEGIGWRIGDQPAMAGMAHGNSGILMPVFALWRKTGEKKYERLAENIWKYENSLFNSTIQNWIDVRENEIGEVETGPVAWCHGAGGVLLSRLNCYRIAKGSVWKERLSEDIKKAYTTLDKKFNRTIYEKQLEQCAQFLIETYEQTGKMKELNVLTDILFLTEHEGCSAGENSYTYVSNGEVYICPAFYSENKEPIGNIQNGLQNKNAHLLTIGYMPLCQVCDNNHCENCKYLNQKYTKEVNISPSFQCMKAETERKVSQQLQEKLINKLYMPNCLSKRESEDPILKIREKGIVPGYYK